MHFELRGKFFISPSGGQTVITFVEFQNSGRTINASFCSITRIFILFFFLPFNYLYFSSRTLLLSLYVKYVTLVYSKLLIVFIPYPFLCLLLGDVYRR